MKAFFRTCYVLGVLCALLTGNRLAATRAATSGVWFEMWRKAEGY